MRPYTADGTSTQIQGLDSFPKDERPTNSQVDVVHLAWDVMVGLGTLLVGDELGRPLNVWDFRMPEVVPPAERPRTIAVIGTSMNAGTTTMAATTIQIAKIDGLKTRIQFLIDVKLQGSKAEKSTILP